MFVGALLGSAGALLLPFEMGWLSIVVMLTVAVIAAAREFGWISFSLPQFKRQTDGTWAMSFRGILATVLWGFDLGLIFTTWLTFSGVWMLATVAVLAKDPVFGAALFSLYWLGRALSVWIAPTLLQDANSAPQFLDEVMKQRRLFQQIHAWGLIWSVVVLVLWLAHK